MVWSKPPFTLSDVADDLDVNRVHALLQTTYWAANRPRDVVQRLIAHSLCFSLLHTDNQIGFARVISDYTTTSWLADMVIDEAYRGRQLGKWVVTCIMAHPRLTGTQFALQTKDAHGFYEQLGFECRPTLMSTAVPYL